MSLSTFSEEKKETSIARKEETMFFTIGNINVSLYSHLYSTLVTGLVCNHSQTGKKSCALLELKI